MSSDDGLARLPPPLQQARPGNAHGVAVCCALSLEPAVEPMSDAPLLAVRDLSIAFTQGGRTTHGGRPGLLHARAGPDAGPRRRIGLGKSVTALSIARLLGASGAETTRARSCSRARICCRSTSATCAAIRGEAITMVFQEPMTSLNPLHTIERQVGEILELHGMRGARQGPRPGHRAPRGGRHPGSGDAARRLSAPAVGRAAPARDDRHGARQPARTC